VDRIKQTALHARFEGMINKGRTRLPWIDNINDDMTSLGLTLRGAMDLTNDRGQQDHSFEHIAARYLASYLASLRQKLLTTY